MYFSDLYSKEKCSYSGPGKKNFKRCRWFFKINVLSYVSEIYTLVVLKDTLTVFKYILKYFNFTYIIINIKNATPIM